MPPYNTPGQGEGSMSDSSDQGDEMPSPDSGGDDTAYLPANFNPDNSIKAGAHISLEVVSVDDDGALEVKMSENTGEAARPTDEAIDALPG